MRILAIRGRNLASLAGDFEVDFEAEPLADAGIFAITGPTGAGKSTLLDAVCLALYDTLPRLIAAQGSARIETGQGDDLTTSDPRLILRHGTGEGFAEVDFIARDGGRYRARWSLQRARRQPRGKLQNRTHSFERLDTGERLGGTRKETLDAIEKVVGLTADQFRRAVLLAQGDFDAFIRARSDERALLLERLTGSGLYARLGAAAYEKAATLRQQLRALEEQITAQNGLDDAARASLEAERAKVQAEAAQLEQELEALGGARRWHKRRQELAGLLAQAEAELERARQAQAEAEGRRQALASRQRAFELAHVWQGLDQHRKAQAAASRRAEECAQAVEQAAADVTRTADALAEAEQAVATAQAEEAALAPQIAQARQLDQSLADLGKALAQLEEDCARHTQEAGAAEAQAQAADAALRQAETERAIHVEWLEAHRHLSRWEAQADELTGQLKTHAGILAQLAELEAACAQATTASTEAQARLAEAGEALGREEVQYRQAQTAMAQAREAAPGEDAFAALMDKRGRLQALQGLHANWQAGLAQAKEAADRHLRLVEEAREAATAMQAAETLRAEIAAELPVLQGQLEEARRTQRLAETAGGEHAALMRETLAEGEPCPVCGSREHELSALDAYIGAQVEEARDRARALEAECDDRKQELAGLAERLRQSGRRRKEVREQAEAQAGEAEEARRKAGALGEQMASSAASLGLEGAAEDIAGEIEEQLALAEEACRRAMGARKQAATAQEAEEAARARLETARAARQEAAEQAQQASQQEQRFQEAHARLAEELQRLAAALDRVLAAHLDWQGLADAGATVQAQISDWRSHDEACRAADASLPALRQALEDGRTTASAAWALLEALRQRCVETEGERNRLRAERGALLSGAAVADVTARLEQAREAAQATREAARTSHSAALQAQSGAHIRQQEVTLRCEELEREVNQRSAGLAARLQTAGLAEADVATVVTAGREALQQEVDALADIDEAVIRAQAAVVARRNDAQEQEATDPPTLTDEQLAEAVAGKTAAQQAVQERLKAMEFDLRRDDEVRAQTAALRAELERKRGQARPWLDLNEVIGDREGKRFRGYAQGLTLDRLLEHANARLAELAPRYALERGQGGDMMIQVVDHDMAGEVRGVHNLSGGERFLVSLALALGLAEMSTGRGLRVESLFIDEGFGALDSASLGQALSVLEQLHASGRRVGVISHVEEVKERIPVKIEVTPVARGRSTVGVTAL